MPKYAKKTYKNLDPAYIKGNTIDGKLYAFPVDANVYAQQMLSFNKELVDKYGLDISNIKSYADAENVLKQFHEKNQIQQLLLLVKSLVCQVTMTTH